MDQAWDRYLTEVLGVREIVRPATESDPGDSGAEADLSSVRLLFLAEPGESDLMGLEIFQKMLAAMKLEPSEFLVWELAPVELSARETVIGPDWVAVCFSTKLADALLAQRPRLRIVTTHHPAACLSDPRLKRPVWEALKSALEKADLASRLQS